MLIPSKLSRPVRLDHTVVRERLLAKLSGANNFRLALITSPAGYGKTTLVSQWAAGKNDLGWYSLDEGDNQQERFASYLIAAIQQATGGHCTTSEAMVQKRQYASLTSLFAQLFIELAEWHRPLYLVVDDYHLISNPAIHEAMRFFLRHQPENLTLVVLSRNLPQLGIANLRVRDQLLEIGSQQLAFNHQEAKQFFDRRLSSPIEAAESSRMCDDVAGWATALQLIALSARQNNHSAHQSARRLAGINASHLSDYLVDEVLDSVDLGTRHFLLKSAILRSMNDALIVRVTGEENGQMRLEEIERQGLFLQRMDDVGEWFSYHPLFGSFLRQRCQWELASELPEIHRAAAESWMAQGFPSEAIHHALAAGDAHMLRDILLNHAWGLFNHSELTLLEESLKALPWESLLENPRLVLLQAWLMQSQHRYGEVNTLLARAEQEMKGDMEPTLHAEFNALRAQVAINDGNPDEAERLAKLALDEELRLKVVRKMFELRFGEPAPSRRSVEQLRGIEGARVRQSYALLAERYGVKWHGRRYDPKDWKKGDTVNQCISAATSCLYGITEAAVLAAGYAPAIGFVHSGKPLSFVYDIADIVKFDGVVPVAFEIAARAPVSPDKEVRLACRDIFRSQKTLARIIPLIEEVLAAGEIEIPKPFADAQPPAIPEPVSLGDAGHRG